MGTFLYARRFLPSLGALDAASAKHVLDCVMGFQANPANPGHSLERLAKANLWSIRASQDLRVILHKDGDTWAFLHADHHDDAYQWASRRTAGRHPVTGAVEIVETIETVREVEKVIIKPVLPDAPPLFAGHADDYLLSLGAPPTWLPTLRKVRSDDELLGVLPHLPEDISERLFRLASGELVTPPLPVDPARPMREAPDTHRRFFVADSEGELLAALQAPMQEWIAFLHPEQRAMANRSFNGPAKVSGSAGTGKTVVALHRARRLAREGKRVLLTTYVRTLCDNLERSLAVLCSPEERARITVSTVHSQALSLVSKYVPARPDTEGLAGSLLRTLHPRLAPSFPWAFVGSEWKNVIESQGIASWPEYRAARRTGRGRALSARDRHALWTLFGEVQARLAEEGVFGWSALCHRAEALLNAGTATSPYDAVLVDEVQDLKAPELRFVRALAASDPGGLMVFGDAGQRIYPGGFSLSALGIEVRGRSTVLRLNYRTTEQIRRFADRLIAPEQDDLDGERESRSSTRSLLGGPEPTIATHRTWDDECKATAQRARRWLDSGLGRTAIAIFARTKSQVADLAEALDSASIPCERLSTREPSNDDAVRLGTLHRAKGLEFKAVAVVGCSSSYLPHPAALADLDDPKDRDEAIERERSLLYVGCTRARDELHLSWHGTPSPFLRDVPPTETP